MKIVGWDREDDRIDAELRAVDLALKRAEVVPRVLVVGFTAGGRNGNVHKWVTRVKNVGKCDFYLQSASWTWSLTGSDVADEVTQARHFAHVLVRPGAEFVDKEAEVDAAVLYQRAGKQLPRQGFTSPEELCGTVEVRGEGPTGEAASARWPSASERPE
jgi:hypothetical protein